VLKVQLEEAKIERQHKEECEAIRRLIAAQPPRAETQRQLNELEKELVGMEAENFAASRTLELRKKQFGLLLHVVSVVNFTMVFITTKFPTVDTIFYRVGGQTAV
jgi:THO complex subunit 7